ncbi:MAG TPA: thioredoxin domain-containing protein, partial [Saprospiraceae bacterium]|nr:thioredoxin domain-containing protein [Saprospiraceae bacterium]
LAPTLWYWIKPYLKKAADYQPLVREFRKLKFDEAYVEHLISKSSLMIPILSDMKTIIVGNQNAPNTLTVVTNPLCGPCIRMHSQFEKLLAKTSEINVQYIFSASGEGKIIADSLLKIPAEFVEEAMHDWYVNRTRTAKQWSEHWAEKIKLGQYPSELLSFHDRWCDLEGVSATPTLYINGYLLPAIYTLDDLPQLVRMISYEAQSRM